MPIDWTPIMDDIKKTKNLIIIDDSKSQHLACDHLLIRALESGLLKNKFIIKRREEENQLRPHHDQLTIDYAGIAGQLSDALKGAVTC